MPRIANPQLGNDILEAATRLLEEGSVEAVTMRAVAAQTGIAVTTIYERFGGRRGLLQALAVLFEREEAKKISKWADVEKMFDHYLQFAKTHPHRYKLLADSFFERLGSGVPVAGFELLRRMLAKRLGGTPQEQSELALGIAELLAGTVTAISVADGDRAYQARAIGAANSLLRRVLSSRSKKQR